MVATRTCPTADEWRAFTSGRFTAAVLDELACHLESCPACEQFVRQLESNEHGLIEMLRSVPTMPSANVPPPVEASFRLAATLAPAASGKAWHAGQRLGR